MPDPSTGAYARYRDGLVRRHIACSGRYLSEVWLKEYEPGRDRPALLRNRRDFTSPAIPGRQPAAMRTYVPWLSNNGEVYGGGDNPLLRGGIAMATFAVEYLVRRHPSSLRYARRLLRYFERSEVIQAGKKTGFLLRCDNYFNVSGEPGKHASTDELVGLILGLYYLFLATTKHPDLRSRVQALASRLGARLQASAYLIIPPTVPAELHRGFVATYVFQWPLQQAFQKITGSRFDPTARDYEIAAATLYAIYQDADHRLKYRAGKEKEQLLGMMYLWVKLGKISGDIASKWTQALRGSIYDSKALEYLFFDFGPIAGFFFDMLRDDLNVDAMADPFKRYVATIRVQDVLTFYRNHESWFNRAMTIHTLQYALDEEVIHANNHHEQAVIVARAGISLLKKMLCGERIPKPVVIPPHYELEPVDDDLYAAVVVRGLLARFVSIAAMKCYPLAQEEPGADLVAFPFAQRVDNAIAARSRMWEELPAGELWWVRMGKAGWERAPVRWHNADTKESARRGMDFCWEHYPDSNRVLAWGRSTHDTATGLSVVQPLHCDKDDEHDYPCLPSDTIKATLDRRVDILFEGGGLDFVFPRTLMSYWLGEPLEFEDAGQPMLGAITCLPFFTNGSYRKGRCAPEQLLLMSSTQGDVS